MTDILLLPSAILVPDELRLDLGQIPTGMIPLHGKPILDHIIESYEDVHPYIACDQRAELITEYIHQEGLDASVIEVNSANSLGETIHDSLGKLLREHSFDDDIDLYVNFSDTIVAPNQPEGRSDFISYAIEQNPIRWTCFEGSDKIDSITPKFDPTATGTYQVFTGLFRFSDFSSYRDELSVALADDENGTDPFYQALCRYLSNREYDLIEADEWIDVGHLDTYYQAKKQFLNVRNFNSLNTENQQNRITKSSDKTETLRSEYNWYTNLPEDLQHFSPAISHYDEASASLELEYIGYPGLRDLHLHGAHGLHIWNQIFDTLFSMLEMFGEYRTSEHVQSSMEEMYLDKTTRRLSQIENGELLSLFNRPGVRINGESFKGLPIIKERLESALREADLFDLGEFTVIHGDLCFSNILFDPRNSIMKLIDPRGEFGTHIIHGDPRYDLAKLRHSVSGNYDFIINDMFDATVEPSGDGVTYDVFIDKQHVERRQLFDSLLKQQFPAWFEDIKLIESLLFLSMVPLHDDSPERQRYMLAHGIKQFNAIVFP